MSMPRSYSSPERRATRHLYPDLTSAYAQIQGRRSSSFEPLPTSHSVTRFPLSPSSSSSDGELSAKNSPERDGIPLTNMPCRKVHSAHGVIHDTEYQHESSAVMESSDEISGFGSSDPRSSAVLEDIVSRYAYTSPSANITNREDDIASQLEDSMLAWNEAVDHLQQSPNPLITRKQQYARRCPSLDTQSMGAVIGADVPDNDFENHALKMSQCRHGTSITSSNMERQDSQLKTINTRISTLSGSKTPASPWDPLAYLADGKPRFSQTADHIPPVKNRSTRRSTRKRAQSGAVLPTCEGDFEASYQPPYPQLPPLSPSSTSASGSASRRTPRHHDWAQSQADNTAPRTSSHILASSLLFPKLVELPFVRSTASPTAQRTTQPSHMLISQPTDSERLRQNGSPRTPLKSEWSDFHFDSHLPTLTQREDAKISDVNVYDFGGTASFGERTVNTQRQHNLSDHEAQTPSDALTHQLLHGGYTTSDSVISRFLRDSRHLRQANSHPHEQRNKLGHGPLGFLTTGSSLANFSSGTTDDRLRSGHTLSTGSHYSTDQDHPAVNTHVTRKFMDFLTGLTPSEQHPTEHTSLGTLNTTTNSTSQSLTLDASMQSFNTIDTILPRNRCPIFPLGPRFAAAATEPKGTRRAPVERMQLRHGAWLEKAWCHKHGRWEFSEARLIGNEAGISVDDKPVQRVAGGILLIFGTLLYLPGGWILIRSMGEGSSLATSTMAEVSRVLVREETGVVCCVHPEDAAMARAIEKTVLAVTVVLVVCWLAVAAWAGTAV